MSFRSLLSRSRIGAVAIMGAATLALLPAAPASAHGEAAQDPFLKTQTIGWFDIEFSKDHVLQGETLDITGKFKVLTEWPESTLPAPETAYMQVGMPGPVLTVRDRRINGEFAPQTIRLEIGKTYDFKYTLAGRRPGRWHVHPGVSVRYAGIILGPARWITVEKLEPTLGNPGGYENEVELLNGKKINLENFGVGTAMLWHLALVIPAALLLLYWLANKPILWRSALVADGDEEALMTPTDRKVTLAMGGLALLVTIGGAAYAGGKWDVIPIQYRSQDAHALPEPAKFVTVDAPTAKVNPDKETYTWDMEVTNTGTLPLYLDSFHVSTEIFKNVELFGPDSPGYDPATAAKGAGAGRTGTRYFKASQTTIAPGETVTVNVLIHDAVLFERRLIPESEVQSRMGGALVFRDSAGNRNIFDISPEVESSQFTGA